MPAKTLRRATRWDAGVKRASSVVAQRMRSVANRRPRQLIGRGTREEIRRGGRPATHRSSGGSGAADRREIARVSSASPPTAIQFGVRTLRARHGRGSAAMTRPQLSESRITLAPPDFTLPETRFARASTAIHPELSVIHSAAFGIHFARSAIHFARSRSQIARSAVHIAPARCVATTDRTTTIANSIAFAAARVK